MAGDPAKRPTFPGIAPEVVRAYLEAPSLMIAEIIDGELSITPKLKPLHAKASLTLSSELGLFHDPNGAPGDWVILPQVELHLGLRPDVLVPDLAGWRRERLPVEPEEAAITLAPDWVCEILSDSTEANDRGKKRRVYRREGVRHYWIVDPRIQTLEVYRLDNGRWNELDTYEGDAVVRAEPFESMALDLARLWRW